MINEERLQFLSSRSSNGHSLQKRPKKFIICWKVVLISTFKLRFPTRKDWIFRRSRVNYLLTKTIKVITLSSLICYILWINNCHVRGWVSVSTYVKVESQRRRRRRVRRLSSSFKSILWPIGTQSLQKSLELLKGSFHGVFSQDVISHFLLSGASGHLQLVQGMIG